MNQWEDLTILSSLPQKGTWFPHLLLHWIDTTRMKQSARRLIKHNIIILEQWHFHKESDEIMATLKEMQFLKILPFHYFTQHTHTHTHYPKILLNNNPQLNWKQSVKIGKSTIQMHMASYYARMIQMKSKIGGKKREWQLRWQQYF